jgi:5-methylcytosine-specific restriction protein A
VARLPVFRTKIPTFETRTVKPPAKAVDAHYTTPEHKAWRRAVMVKAKWRCEAVEGGVRCTRHAPKDRLFADHIVEVADGGDLLDPMNGQAMCGSHHTSKTVAERGKRAATSFA